MCFGPAEASDRPVGRLLLSVDRAGPYARGPECLNIVLSPGPGLSAKVRIEKHFTFGDGGSLRAAVRGRKDRGGYPGDDGFGLVDHAVPVVYDQQLVLRPQNVVRMPVTVAYHPRSVVAA